MGAPDFSRVQEPNEISATLTSSSSLKPSDAPVEDICKFLEKVQQAPTLDHATLQRIFRALQSWLKSYSSHKMLESGIVPALAKVCDSLLLADYNKSDVVTSLLDLLFLVEDISEVPSGKDICGKHFIPRILDLALTKLASVNLRRAAVETLCVLITKCPGNQCALLDRMPDCLLVALPMWSLSCEGVSTIMPNLRALLQCGDFQLQASTAETLYRLSRREPQLLNCLKDEVLRGALRSLHNMKNPDLLTEIRDFVILLNESLGPFRSVYSFLSEWVVVNGRNIATEKWVDFGRTLFSLSSLFEPSSTPAKQTDDCGALIIDILYLDIIDIRKSSAKQLEIIAHERNSSSASIQDKPSGCRQMHIRISFAPEDLLMIMKHVVPKIHLRQGGQDDITAGGSSCRSSQGILIPLRRKGDEETSNIHTKENGAGGEMITPSKLSTDIEVRSTAYDSHVKSPCSQIIEETLANVEAEQHLSPVRCERATLIEIGALSARSTKEFKKPADRPSSSNGLERQPETQRQQEGSAMAAIADKDVVQKEPESRGVPAQHGLLQKLKLTRSAPQSILANACVDQKNSERQKSLSEAQLKAAGGEQKVNEGDAVAITESKAGTSTDESVSKRNVGGAQTLAVGKPMGQHMKHPAAGQIVAKKMSDNSLKAEPKSRLVSKDPKVVSVAKRRQSGGDDLSEVTGMPEGHVAKVESRLQSKRVRLQDENGNQNSLDLLSQMPNREPKGGDKEDRGAAVSNTRVYITRTGMKQPVVSDSTKTAHQQAELRRKRQVDPLADKGDPHESEPETQERTSKRLKRPTTTDPIETDSDKLEKPLKRVTVTKTAPKRRGANRKEEQVRKPRGRPPKEKALAPNDQNVRQDRGTNFENVYSFSQTEGLQTTRSRGRKAVGQNEAQRECSPAVQMENCVYALLGSPREHDGSQENILLEETRLRSSNGERKPMQDLDTDVDNAQKEDVRGFLRGQITEEDKERPVEYSSAVKEGAAGAPKERESKQEKVSWREKAFTSSTKRREPLRDLQLDFGNVLSKPEDVHGPKPCDQDHREDKQSPPEYSPAILKRKCVPPLLKSYDKQKENNVCRRSWGQVEDSLSPVGYIPAVRKGKAVPLRYQKLPIRSPSARVSIDLHVEAPKEKEKVLTSRTKFRKNSKDSKENIDKMLGCEKPQKKRELKSGIRVIEEEEDVDIYYSSPVPAVRSEVKAARKRLRLSSSPKSDEASDDEVFSGEDWGRGPKWDVLSANEDQEVAADIDSSAHVSDKEQCLSGRASQSAGQRRWKSSTSPRVKFTDADDSDEDVASAGVNTEDRVRSSKWLSHRMKTKNLTVVKDDKEDEEEDEDKDEGEEGVGRAVKMVAKMLKKFRRKVKVQTKKKTTQILTAALENVELEADAFHVKVQQNFNGFVKICKRKFENLEARLQDQNKRATIWQEKVVDDFEGHLREYAGLSIELKETENDLQGLAEKERATQMNLFSQLQVSSELHLANADKKILAIKKAAKRMLGLRDVLKSFQLGDGE